MTRQGKTITRQGNKRKDETQLDKIPQNNKTTQDKTRQQKTTKDNKRQHNTTQDRTIPRQGKARQD